MRDIFGKGPIARVADRCSGGSVVGTCFLHGTGAEAEPHNAAAERIGRDAGGIQREVKAQRGLLPPLVHQRLQQRIRRGKRVRRDELPGSSYCAFLLRGVDAQAEKIVQQPGRHHVE